MPRFVDTNILIYAEDRDSGRKHEVARDLVMELMLLQVPGLPFITGNRVVGLLAGAGW